MKKTFCDKCHKEFEYSIYQIITREGEKVYETLDICGSCRELIREFIGLPKIRAIVGGITHGWKS